MRIESNSLYSFVFDLLAQHFVSFFCIYLFMVCSHGSLVFHCINKPHVIYLMDIWFIPSLGTIINSTASNILVHEFWYAFLPKNGIAGLQYIQYFQLY